MNKTAFVFPGQGAQAIGMGSDFYENYELAKKMFDEASEAVGLDLRKLCFEENEDINITEFTQVALLTTSVAILEVLKEKGFKADITAGLSLGEYCALVAAGAMDKIDAAKAVRKRGIFMQEEVPAGEGTMAAVLGLDESVIDDVVKDFDEVDVANYNCPGQIVISGETLAVRKAAELCKEAGARKCVELKVSGPFHSKLLSGAGTKLQSVLDDIEIKKLDIPYVANVNAEIINDEKEIKPLLVKQVSNSVRWQQSVETMLDFGVERFVEIGPGKTLAGFNKKISRALKKDIVTINISNIDEMEKAMEELAK